MSWGWAEIGHGSSIGATSGQTTDFGVLQVAWKVRPAYTCLCNEAVQKRAHGIRAKGADVISTQVGEQVPTATDVAGLPRRAGGSGRYWPPSQGAWTYDDYARLPENGFRYEVIQGGLYMSPAPRPRHQRAAFRLAYLLEACLESTPVGAIYLAPIDVILPDLADPVQPDLIFIAAERLDIVSDTRIEAPPDMIAEVLSPGTARRDRMLKFETYARAGVREYWIIDPAPDARTVEIYVLRGDAYALAGTFRPGDVTASEVLPECGLKVDAFL